MVFSSHLFIFYFLPAALFIYYSLPKRGKHLGLTLMSYLFYGWSNPLFVLLMFSSTVIDYFCGLIISGSEQKRAKKIALICSICSNLSLLGFFKYFNFAMENYDSVLRFLELEQFRLDFWIKVTLPLGISFYTFQSMSYTIDVYRGHAKAIRNFTDFSCYVSMFPQLVAGPIVRFQEIAKQLEDRCHSLEKCARGLSFFCIGMAKKILLANPCGKIADTVFDTASPHAIDAWVGIIAYSMQIYYDFSAYSDMAIGLGLMLGFVFAKNFDSPYHSKSITEFWQRWHLSLSHWLRDYLYIPLGGNRKGELRTYFNLSAVMLLGGLWHGASWNFLCWGAIHGGMLAFERAQGKESIYRLLPGPCRVLITYIIVLFAWVFFRAETLGSAFEYCKTMLFLQDAEVNAGLISGVIYQPYYVLILALSLILVWCGKQTWDLTRKMSWPKTIYCIILFYLSILVLTAQSYNPFIYFMF